MPFTPSHAVVALPFRRTPLVASAVAIGSMAPDLPYFVPFDTHRLFTHSPLGVLTIDVAIGLVAWLAWILFLRAPAFDLMPRIIRERLATADRVGGAVFVLLLLVSLLIGAATHVLWDSFTHEGAMVEAWAVLREPVGPLPVFKWLQHGSSVVGLTIIGLALLAWMRRTPRTPRTDVTSARFRLVAWLVVAVIFAASVLVTWIAALLAGSHPFDPSMLFVVARVSIGLTIGTFVVVCALWWLRRIRRRA